jgi:hypothetical protein
VARTSKISACLESVTVSAQAAGVFDAVGSAILALEPMHLIESLKFKQTILFGWLLVKGRRRDECPRILAGMSQRIAMDRIVKYD